MKRDEDAANLPKNGEAFVAGERKPNLKDPAVVLSLLEADQVVAAKRELFGRRKLSRPIQGLLWGLRIYVVVMLVIVLIAILRVAHAIH